MPAKTASVMAPRLAPDAGRRTQDAGRRTQDAQRLKRYPPSRRITRPGLLALRKVPAFPSPEKTKPPTSFR